MSDERAVSCEVSLASGLSTRADESVGRDSRASASWACRAVTTSQVMNF